MVWTYDSGKLKIYVNGRHESTDTEGSGNVVDNSAEGNIAARNNGDMTLSGTCCGARLYDRALTPHEVQYLYSVSNSGRMSTSGKES